MKTVIILLSLLFISPSWAEAYLGCGLGLMRQALPEADWLKPAAGQLASVSCHYTANPEVQKAGFFLALPDLYWQRDSYSAEKLQQNSSLRYFRQLNVDWLFLRQDDFMFGLSAGYQKQQQQRELSTNLRWLSDQNLLLNNDSISLEQKHSYHGVLIDFRYLNAPIHYLRITRHHYEQPMRINGTALPALTDATLKTWQLDLGHPARGFGWQWHWQVGMATGRISHSIYPAVTALDLDDFVDINVRLGLLWRYRYNSHLHPFIDLSGQGQWWLFSDRAYFQNLPASTEQYGYQITTGLSWRF